MGAMPKIRSKGRSAAVIPADRPVDARLKWPSRGHFSHTFSATALAKGTCCSRERQFHHRVVWADEHDAFNRSRGRLAAGKASDRSGVVVRHTTTSRVLGEWILRYRVGALDLLLKRATVLSVGGTGRWARCHRSGRQTDQRPENRKIVSREPPAMGLGSVNKVFTATFQLITVG